MFTIFKSVFIFNIPFPLPFSLYLYCPWIIYPPFVKHRRKTMCVDIFRYRIILSFMVFFPLLSSSTLSRLFFVQYSFILCFFLFLDSWIYKRSVLYTFLSFFFYRSWNSLRLVIFNALDYINFWIKDELLIFSQKQ